MRNGLRRHTFFWLVRKGAFQPRFLSRMGKKAPLAADRRRPFRCSSFSHTNRCAGFAWEPVPFANPLKRPRRGLRPPSLDFPRGLACDEIISDYQNVLQMRICQTGVVVEILCGCFGCDLNGSPLFAMRDAALAGRTAYRLPYVKYSTGANEATRTVYRALGKPNQTAARRAFGLRLV